MKAKGKRRDPSNKPSVPSGKSPSTKDANYSVMQEYATIVVGLCVALYLGYEYAKYAKMLHENDMWFSNIKQVEREISFRTESGLYFSYYKQFVLAPSISEGLHQLTHDNVTEHLRTINILERFNIYQEVFLGILYRLLPKAWQLSIEYVYFYIDAIFGLHGVYLVAMFISSWLISGSFLAGVLANSFFVFNRWDMTRLSYTMPLRESFSLPFIYIQVAVLTYYFKKDVKASHKNICLLLIALSTFCFTITWQFAQFVLLLESFALYGIYALEFTRPHMVRSIYMIIVGNLATVCFLQFGNDMLYTSLASSFCVAAIILLTLQSNEYVSGGLVKKLLVLLMRIAFVLVLTFAINISIKKLTKVDSDEHVFKFVSAKLGHGEALKNDFDSRLYLCEGSFQYLPFNTFERLTQGIVFPVYAVSTVMVLLALAYSYLYKLRGMTSLLDDYPEVVFNIILSVFFGGMALTTLRMKFLWMPHMCILAAGVFCHQDAWKSVANALHLEKTLSFLLRHSVPIVLCSMVLFQKLSGVQEELKQLREFHDPDTVELMEWIKSSTPEDAAFTGSMQLLAGVKLCTDRPITNHPHYENKFLRQRTKEVYQIYARRSPEEVYKILRKHGTSYIILENSICYSRQDQGCRLTDILDVDNGHRLNERGGTPRFCDAIKLNGENFRKYFYKVFENRTFYLYKLLG